LGYGRRNAPRRARIPFRGGGGKIVQEKGKSRKQNGRKKKKKAAFENRIWTLMLGGKGGKKNEKIQLKKRKSHFCMPL